ncbi:hypothetical protein DNTS_024686 [Danionella cerebrum]|uniref:Uncharacterized protein n=1 Tax=Danionella cerebrum TaxID=2873325 RepID=A0A553QLN6_9TELE|nr:hypothetical protein DNTS_024686 [Danionella translucida]
MANDKEENAGQPLWQSVMLFACKGMIEGIIVLLFFWLLVQVLFTKQLEVHLQILLSVGLVVLCCSLIMGCIICWLKTRHKPPESKGTVRAAPIPKPVDQEVMVVLGSSPPRTTFSTLQYDELEGEVLDYPSTLGSSTPSDEEVTSVAEFNKHKSCFQMRRLSSPSVTSSIYKPMSRGRASLPTLPRLGLLAKTRKVLERHCSVAGDSYSFSEHRRLTLPNPHAPCTLTSRQTQDLLQEETLFPNYGSQSCNETSDPFLHFSLTFSPTHNTLTISLVGITGVVHSKEEITISVRLPPLCPEPQTLTPQDYNLSSGLYKRLEFHVGSLDGLRSCILRLAVCRHDHPKVCLFEEVEVFCRSLDWTPDRPVNFVRELRKVVEKNKS